MTIDTSKLKRYKPGYVHSNDGPGYLSMLARDDGEYVRLEDVKAISSALEQALTQRRGELPSAKTFASAVWRDWMTNEQADKLGAELHAWLGAHVATTPQPSADAVREVPDGDHGLAEFTEYFVKNYPGPDTIIYAPEWHAPKIFRAARRAMLSAASGEGVDDTKRLDWIARQGGYEFDFGILNDQPGDGDWFVHGMGGSGQGATFRDAIDAAIKEEAGGQDANTDILDTLAFKTENGDAGCGSVTYIALVASGEADHQQNAAQGGGEK